jgi:DNA-binding NtrC family response regulator
MNTKKRKSVLYVDDQPENLMLFECMFSEEFDITCSLDPIVALSLIRNNTYKVVISDYMMPKMNGIEFLEILKQDFPEITRIMLTGNADYELEKEAKIKCDLFECLTKPMNMKIIENTINNALRTTEPAFN